MLKSVIVVLLFAITESAIAQTGAIVGSVIGAIIGKVAGKAAFQKSTSGHAPTRDEILEFSVKAVNDKAPVTLDEFTRLDGATAEPDHALMYHFTVLKTKKADVSTKVFYTEFAQELRTKVCSKTDLDPFFQKQIKVIFSYKSSDDKNIGSVIINPKDCGF